MSVGLGESVLAMVCAGLFALAFGVVGTVLIVLYVRNKKKAKASETWPSTEGKIVSHHVRVDYSQDDESNRVDYVPEVHFEYQVEGQSFAGKRISFGSEQSFNKRQKAEMFLEQYPVGQVVTVFFNPEKPQESVLQQTMRKMTVQLVVGILLVVMMICFLCPVMMAAVNTLTSR